MSYTTADELNTDIKEWLSVSQWLTKAKEKEMLLRQKLAKHIFANKLTPSGDLPKGTVKDKFSSGNLQFKAKAVGKFNISVLEEMESATLAELGDAATNLVKRKPELSVSAYNALSEKQQTVADRMLSIKPGAPELEIEILPTE